MAIEAIFFFSNISSSYIYTGRRCRQVAIYSVPKLGFWSSGNASSINISVKLKLVILLNQDLFSTVFHQSFDFFYHCFEYPVCHVSFVNFGVVFRTLSHWPFNCFYKASPLLVIDRFSNTPLNLPSNWRWNSWSRFTVVGVLVYRLTCTLRLLKVGVS